MSPQPQTFDAARAEQFAGHLFGVVNHAATALMASIGHRTGLFDRLAELPPSTSEEVAAATGLDERYVREWLSALAAAGVVEYDGARRTYRLPAEHAASLTRSAGPQNVALLTQLFAVLGGVEDGIVRSFQEGGGVHYHEFSRFHEVMAEISRAQFESGILFEHVLPQRPQLLDRLRRGARVLEIGCGAGTALIPLAEAFPASRFVGYDLCPEPIEWAQAEARRRGLDNVTFAVRDVTRLEDVAAYDLVAAFDAIHDQAKPAEVLEGVRRALVDDGTFLMVDIAASSDLAKNLDHPLGTYLYSVSTMHCMTVSLAQGGDGLGTCWGEELAHEMLAAAGFAEVETHHFDGDPLNGYTFARPASRRADA